ncbi:MAG: tRNA lysidine(34) synthetase TilS [Armatimonadetes bacterium]|nr:tRNA lysidine(34) synthetase TilS [Armatimonadota bacterium]MDW8027140.1 tRNA lysidine(34) synthetase TilS [Armatimonadota bacterium]
MPNSLSVVVEGLHDWEYIAAPEAVTHKVKEAILRFRMLELGEKIVVAVSGGPDSLTLLHILWRLKDEFGWQIFAAHFNHGLRGEEADEDEKFVKDFCERFQIPSFSRKSDIKAIAREQKLSIVQAGRRARYRFFAEVASQVGASKVALGHTATDAIETLLINLFRGTGTDGLQGIPPMSPLTILDGQFENKNQIWLVRPLILCWRIETTTYAKVYGLQPRLDRSNLDTKILRNWVRLELLPLLRERFGKVDDALWRLCELARDESAFLNQIAEEQLSEILIHADSQKLAVSRDGLLKATKGIQRRIFRLMVERLLSPLNEVSLEHVEEAIGVIERHFTDASYHLPQGLFMQVTKGMVWLIKLETK